MLTHLTHSNAVSNLYLSVSAMVCCATKAIWQKPHVKPLGYMVIAPGCCLRRLLLYLMNNFLFSSFLFFLFFSFLFFSFLFFSFLFFSFLFFSFLFFSFLFTCETLSGECSVA